MISTNYGETSVVGEKIEIIADFACIVTSIKKVIPGTIIRDTFEMAMECNFKKDDEYTEAERLELVKAMLGGLNEK